MEKLYIKAGVPQSRIISAELCLLFMNDLIAILENKFGRENTTTFADDLSEMITEEANAESYIKTVRSRAQDNDMELNMKKGNCPLIAISFHLNSIDLANIPLTCHFDPHFCRFWCTLNCFELL